MLFSELEGAGMSREVGPIAVMLYEHGLARARGIDGRGNRGSSCGRLL